MHIADDAGRVAMIEVVNPDYSSDDFADELIRYIYSNHLGSSALELDDSGDIISYDEYHPYGTTSYQAMNADIKAAAKRYRFTGKERDEESGLNYHGARYYIPWLCRWAAVDPLESKYAGWSSYCYLKGNPINDTDSTGTKGDKDDPPDSKIQVNIHIEKELTPEQMVDALKISANEVSKRIAGKLPYDIDKEGSLKPLGEKIVAYSNAHHLTQAQTVSFYKNVQQSYKELTTIALWNRDEFQKLNRSVVNNPNLKGSDKINITIGRSLEAYHSLGSTVFSALQAALLIAGEGAAPGAVGKGPRGTLIGSETQSRIVSLSENQIPKSLSERITSGSSDIKNLRIVGHDEDLYQIKGNYNNVDVEIQGYMKIEGKKLIVESADYGGAVGTRNIRKLVSEFGKQVGVDEVDIYPGKRTTGANPGKVPRPFNVKVN